MKDFNNMTDYVPPVQDMMFMLRHVVGWEGLPQMDALDEDDVRLVLESAGALAAGVLAPLNASGDREGSRLEDGEVRTPAGFRAAYAQYRDNGWNGVPFPEDYGGQGLPWMIAFAVQEMWQGANMAFGLCPLLNQGAVEAILRHGDAAQKALYLEKLVSGVWTGTMNLTEPDAGSDLGAVKTRAEPQADGTYRIRGQKIFITYGEHDLAENIVHLVLARTPEAPAGTRGISLFVVPKFLPDENGNPGARNDVRCVAVEHKLGIHASPTCTMQYGDADGAVGWLVGRENEGLKYMFTMMNNARLCVGLQGIAVAERAWQHARAYARERVQGTPAGDKSGGRVPIIAHADVRRMLLSMRARILAARALAYEAGRALDLAHRGDAAAQARVDILTPVVKAWSTDLAVDAASLGVQIYGGAGYIEESGAPQYLRDARILPIYEGTNGIQAMDLCFRKILLDGGAAMRDWLAEAGAMVAGLPPEMATDAASITRALTALDQAAEWLLARGQAGEAEAVAASAVPFLSVFATVAGAVVMARAAQEAIAGKGGDAVFCETMRMTAQFYNRHILPQAHACAETVREGAESVCAFDAARFG